MPTMDVAHQHMLSARAHGGDQMDWTALVGGERISAGLQPFGSRVCLLLVFIYRSTVFPLHPIVDIELSSINTDDQVRLERYEG